MKNVKEITITIEGEDWQKALDKSFKKRNKEVKIEVGIEMIYEIRLI